MLANFRQKCCQHGHTFNKKFKEEKNGLGICIDHLVLFDAIAKINPKWSRHLDHQSKQTLSGVTLSKSEKCLQEMWVCSISMETSCDQIPPPPRKEASHYLYKTERDEFTIRSC